MITSPSALQFKFAANTAGKDKNWDFNLLATRYKDREGTIEDVKRHVSSGHALCAGLLGGKRRSKANVIGSQWLLLDIDNSSVQKDESGQPIKGEDGKAIKIYDPQLTLDAALTHPFIQKHCALIYTTASHRPDWHKFRLVFLLPEYVEGADTVEACTRFLMQHLPHDPACKDASRVFYGNSKAEFPLVQPNATLPLDWVRQARETAQKERIEHAEQVRRIEERKRSIRERADVEDWDTDALIQQALSFIPQRVPNSGNYKECLSVLMALYAYYGVEAEALAESWSPSIKGTTWNIRQKIRSFRSGRTNGITIGTLFHIAKQYGFKFPKRESTPYVKTQKETEVSARGQEIIEQAQFGFDRLRKLISKAIATPIQYVAPKVKRRVKAPKTVTYVPGTLPTPDEYKALGEPKIHFDPSQRVQIWQEAVAKGWNNILDNSHPGLGKSYIAGNLTPADLGVDKLFYQDGNHRNPSVATVESNFVDLPVRNNGFKIDATRQTASGQDYQVRTKPGEMPDTEGNCHRDHLFGAFRSKNFSSVDFEDSSESPICAGCSLSNQCKFSAGSGYGFRFQKRKAIQESDRLRAHPDSTPTVLTGKDEKVFSVGRIWEEAGQLLNSVKSVEVTLEDFNQIIGHLALELPDEFEKLRPVLGVLRSFLSQEFKPSSRYGFDDRSIRAKLPPFPQDLDITAIKAALSPELGFLTEKDGIEFNQVDAKKSKALRYAAREMEKQGAREAGREFLDLPLYWLPDFLEAWGGGGSLRCDWGKLGIYTRNTKHKELAEGAKFNIYLDATLTSKLLKMKLGIDRLVLVVEQQTPSYANLKIVHVTGLGKLGKERGASCTERVNALKDKFAQLYTDLGILDWKAIALRALPKAIASKSERTEYGHFVDGRGVNRFEGNSAIASFGVPYANIGAIAAQYQVMTGRTINLDQDDTEFQEYITALVDAEIIQEIGRLRAHRRPNEPLTFYFCGDYDTEFLKEVFPGAAVEQVDAFTITPDAGSEGQQTRWRILQAVKQLVESGQKVTQQAIATVAEISQPLVSKVSSQLGGWDTLKKLLLTLLESLYSSSNNFSEPLDPEQRWMIDSYLPLLADSRQVKATEAATSLIEVVEAYGERVFQHILLNIPRRLRVRLISQMLVAVVQVVPPHTLEFDYFAEIAQITA